MPVSEGGGGFRHSPNAWFHGPIRVHVAYGTSIGSSVLEGQGAELRMFSMRSLPGMAATLGTYDVIDIVVAGGSLSP